MSLAMEAGHQEPVVVSVTTPEEELAVILASQLVESRLAACVQIVNPVRSIYRWNGAVEDEREVLLVIKTTRHALSGIANLLADRHPYDVPELAAVPIVDGSPSYLDWIVESVG